MEKIYCADCKFYKRCWFNDSLHRNCEHSSNLEPIYAKENFESPTYLRSYKYVNDPEKINFKNNCPNYKKNWKYNIPLYRGVREFLVGY